MHASSAARAFERSQQRPGPRWRASAGGLRTHSRPTHGPPRLLARRPAEAVAIIGMIRSAAKGIVIALAVDLLAHLGARGAICGAATVAEGEVTALGLIIRGEAADWTELNVEIDRPATCHRRYVTCQRPAEMVGGWVGFGRMAGGWWEGGGRAVGAPGGGGVRRVAVGDRGVESLPNLRQDARNRRFMVSVKGRRKGCWCDEVLCVCASTHLAFGAWRRGRR